MNKLAIFFLFFILVNFSKNQLNFPNDFITDAYIITYGYFGNGKINFKKNFKKNFNLKKKSISIFICNSLL